MGPETPQGLTGVNQLLDLRGVALQRVRSSKSFRLHSGFHTLIGQT